MNGNNPGTEYLLTADDVATLLRTTRKAVYAMSERGRVAGVTRVGRRLLFRRDLVLQWLEGKRAKSAAEVGL